MDFEETEDALFVVISFPGAVAEGVGAAFKSKQYVPR